MWLFRILPIVALLATFGVHAGEEPDVLVRQLSDDVLTILRSNKDMQSGNPKKAIDQVANKVTPHFNFRHMTALAIGKSWNVASVEQQNKLESEFRVLLLRTYANALTGYKNQTVKFKASQVSGEEALVRSDIVQPGSHPISVNYSLELSDNGWKIFDVTIDGISLIASYRGQFSQEIRSNGVEGLLRSMSEKNRSLEK